MRKADTAGPGVECEVVGFRDDRAICMPFGHLEGVRMDARAVIVAEDVSVRPSEVGSAASSTRAASR